MKEGKFFKGFTLLELLIVIGVIAIAVAIALPSVMAYYRIYKFNEYAYSMENLVRWSKLTAMERSISVGLCVDNTAKTLTIVNMGVNRIAPCTGAALNTFRIEDDFVSLEGSNPAFDPRGFAIFMGNVCVSKNTNERYYKVLISKFGAMRIERGNGGCQP